MYFIRSILAATIILFLSVISTPSITPGNLLNIQHIDKIVHFILYAGLSFILLLDFNKLKIRKSIKSSIFVPILIAVLYGGLIEFIQILIPGRSGEVLDFVSDIGGALTGMLIFFLYQKILKRRGFKY